MSVISLDQLSRSLDSVGRIIAGIAPEQWVLPTPCAEWDVRRVVEHVVGMNLVFAAMMTGQPRPERGGHPLGDDAAGAYSESAAALVAALSTPGILEQTFESPLGSATGEDRLKIRLYDLLAHGWDLAQATGQKAIFPEDASQTALGFAQTQLEGQPRDGRFDAVQPVAANAPTVDKLAAFLGRKVVAAS